MSKNLRIYCLGINFSQSVQKNTYLYPLNCMKFCLALKLWSTFVERFSKVAISR